MSVSKEKIIIEGITESGERFRPADWADRMSGTLSTFRNRRLHYSPLLQTVYKSDYKCVAIDPQLKDTNPELYQSLLDFAKANHLRVCKESEMTEAEEEKS